MTKSDDSTAKRKESDELIKLIKVATTRQNHGKWVMSDSMRGGFILLTLG